MTAQTEALDGEILGPEPEDEKRVRRDFWATVKRAARQVPMMEDVVAAYYAALDPETPLRVRAVLVGALAYFVMPLDAIPDMLAVVGFSDDVTVLTGAIAMVIGHIKDRHRAAAKKALEERG